MKKKKSLNICLTRAANVCLEASKEAFGNLQSHGAEMRITPESDLVKASAFICSASLTNTDMHCMMLQRFLLCSEAATWWGGVRLAACRLLESSCVPRVYAHQ